LPCLTSLVRQLITFKPARNSRNCSRV
jgi:hypothetical protein